MVAYHFIYVFSMVQVQAKHLNTHLGFSLIIVFLSVAQQKEKDSRRFIFIAMALLALVGTIYIQVMYRELRLRTWFNTPLDIAVGVVLMVVSLEAARRAFGLVIPVITLLVVLYPFLGHHLPEPFYCTVYSLARTLSNLSLTFRTGLHDAALSASANYIFLFVVFGSVLQSVGATEFFLQCADQASAGNQACARLARTQQQSAVGLDEFAGPGHQADGPGEFQLQFQPGLDVLDQQHAA